MTSCDSCHSQATCLKLEAEDTSSTGATLSCQCKDGFVGDGINCYDVKECGADSSCCSAGYEWSPKQGCVDIDECSLTQSPCGASQICQNTQGSFECVTNLARRKRSVPVVQSVQFPCGGVLCPHGMACITLNGTASCADPCEHYTVLDDPWRATDNGYTEPPKCDLVKDWPDWNRLFLNGSSAQITERCIDILTCGTYAPMSITAPHPTQSSYIESRSVCGHWEDSCCFYDAHSTDNFNSSNNINSSNDNFNSSTDDSFSSNNNFCSSNDNFCSSNDNFCSSNDNFCSSNDNFCSSNNNFSSSNDNFFSSNDNFRSFIVNFCSSNDNFNSSNNSSNDNFCTYYYYRHSQHHCRG
ncbi:hypothetical protein WMY93_033326 [Mugilogobius chulae]|uniref:EGF-like domain-containing protein n=1 Tax=Mugilogobius chulae TaxID=88201 RepID=A0AAW0MNY2_9GOBI